jgi:hypothetical protein
VVWVAEEEEGVRVMVRYLGRGWSVAATPQGS